MLHRVSATLIVGLLLTNEALAARYFIDENTDFTGNGCQNSDLNTITSSLRSRLDGASWTGSRFVNAGAYPQDFVETCSSAFGAGGLDSAFGDSAVLTIYAGHGNVGLVQFGFARNGVCLVDMDGVFDLGGSGMMRLGQMAGAQAGYAVWLTSCTLRSGTLPNNANFQWMNQQFGYHNSPSIGDNTPREWYDDIDPKSNKQAWLDAMEDKPGLFTGDNSPMVVSYGSTASACTSEHNNKMLKRQILTPRSGGPACGGGLPFFNWCSTLRNNGTSSTCAAD